MIYRDDITDLLEQVVAGVDPSMQVTDSMDNGDGTQTITVCDIKWTEPGRTFTIGPDTYTIESLDPDNRTITVSPAAPLIAAPSTFNLYQPFFFHGTPIQTSEELQERNDATQKTPMVYLMENMTEAIDDNDESNIDRVSNLRIFFLTQGDFDKWQTEDFYANAIRPMRRLLENFVAELRQTSRFDTRELGYEVTNHARFGVYISNRGVEKSLFLDNLSGVEMTVELTVLKDLSCPPC
jgi:hypothetical protein